VRVTVNAGAVEISTKQKCDSSKRNITAGRLEGKAQASKMVNDYLDVVQRKVYEIRKQLLDTDQAVTAENIKTLLQGKEIKEDEYLLMKIFQRHNEQMTQLVGREFAPATLTRYKTVYTFTQSFLQWKYKVTDMDVTKLDYEFISEFEFWLKSVRRCNHNTTMQYLRNFNKIVNHCLRSGWLTKNPFIKFKMTDREVERTALTETELQKNDRTRIFKDAKTASAYLRCYLSANLFVHLWRPIPMNGCSKPVCIFIGVASIKISQH